MWFSSWCGHWRIIRQVTNQPVFSSGLHNKLFLEEYVLFKNPKSHVLFFILDLKLTKKKKKKFTHFLFYRKTTRITYLKLITKRIHYCSKQAKLYVICFALIEEEQGTNLLTFPQNLNWTIFQDSINSM